MKTFAKFLVLALLTALAVPAVASSRYAYVPRSGTDTVAVYDTQTNTVTASITVQDQPWAVAMHPRGHRAYIANFGSDTVSIINTANNTVVKTVTVGDGPYHLAINPAGTQVWVTGFNSDNVAVIDTVTETATLNVVSNINSANAIAFNPSGSTAYVTNYSDGALWEINTQTLAKVSYTIPAGSEGIAVHPDGSRVYLSFNNGAVNYAQVFNTTTKAIVNTASLGGTGAWGVAVHPNGRFWYVAWGRRVAVLRTSDNGAVVGSGGIDIGNNRAPTGVTIDAAGTFGYTFTRETANGRSHIYKLNLITNTIVGSVNTGNGSGPYSLGFSLPRPLLGHGSIAAGQYHSCRVRADKSIDCWGRNDLLQATPPSTGTYTQVVAGSAHSCALRTDGTVTCWGNNSYGQTNAPASTFVSLSSGARHVCGLLTTGGVACWGENDQGQATAPAGTTYVSVSSGSSHSCAVRNTGTPNAVCWGRNTEGQATVPAGDFVQIEAGAAFSCGLLSSGSVSCWGDATDGKTTPASGTYAKLSAQSSYGCGLRNDDTLACWGGDNVYGERNVPTSAQAALGQGRFHSCSLAALGTTQCWGWNLYNQAPQFAIEQSSVGSGSVGTALIPQTFTMEVSNPGIRNPYTPRPAAFSVVAGTLPNGLSLSAAGVLSGTPTFPGTFNFTVQGEDANGFVAQAAFSMAVSGTDATPPVVTPVVTGTAGSNGWFRSDVTVEWTVTDGQSQVSSMVGCGPTTISAETASTMVTCVATSLGGPTSVSYEVKIDRTAPTMAITATNKRPKLNEVITVDANGTDPLSGVATEVCDPAPTNVVSPVPARINCTVTDNAGNSSTRPFAYVVVYGFSGFQAPIYNPSYFNDAALNQDISFVYRVTDVSGAGVAGLAAPTFTSFAVSCPATVKGVAPAAASAPGFVERTDLGTGWYEFTWTSPASAGCAALQLNLGDGDHVKRVNFRFQ